MQNSPPTRVVTNCRAGLAWAQELGKSDAIITFKRGKLESEADGLSDPYCQYVCEPLRWQPTNMRCKQTLTDKITIDCSLEKDVAVCSVG